MGVARLLSEMHVGAPNRRAEAEYQATEIARMQAGLHRYPDSPAGDAY